jgi:hypothetical protein
VRYRKGQRIKHKALGLGTVIGYITGNFGDGLEIDFDIGGMKQLILAFCVGRIRKVQRKAKK